MSASGIPLGRFVFPLDLNNRAYVPNLFNGCLQRETNMWERVQNGGGLKLLCPGTKYQTPPWVRMPPQGRRFSPISSISLPTNDGNDHLVTSFLVPLGYDGVIVTVVANYSGQGFVEGSGDLTWRLQLNERYVKDYGNLQTSVGSLTIPTNIQNSIFLLSGQLVQFFVNRSVGSVSLVGGRIVCGLLGWYWPR